MRLLLHFQAYWSYCSHTRFSSYVDTVVLINSWIAYPLLGPGSGAIVDESDGEEKRLDPRSEVAIARLNYIHGKYKGRIVSCSIFARHGLSTIKHATAVSPSMTG